MDACARCYAKLEPGDKFCPMCGDHISRVSDEREKLEVIASEGAIDFNKEEVESPNDSFMKRKKQDHQFAMKVQKCANEQELDELLESEGFSFRSADLNYNSSSELISSEDEVDKTEKLKSELRGWGIGLIILGFLHFALAGFLDPLWGVVIIIVGILNLTIIKPYILIINGVVLVLVGLMNILSTLSYGFSGWIVFGGAQIYWGILEIVKYQKYASSS